jgi:hypothetical protein
MCAGWIIFECARGRTQKVARVRLWWMNGDGYHKSFQRERKSCVFYVTALYVLYIGKGLGLQVSKLVQSS